MSAVSKRLHLDRIWVLIWLLTSCADEPRGEPQIDAVTPSDPTVWFHEVAAKRGVDFTHVAGERRWWFPEIMGSGLGLADLDGDGALDLYAVQAGDLTRPGAAQGENRLFHNLGAGTFEDITGASGTGDRGYGMGCAFGDVDGDGQLDLYVTNVGPNALLANRGALRFEDVSTSSGTAGERWATSCAFLDYDGDGDLDLFVANYVNWSSEREIECSSANGPRDYCSPKNYNAPAADLLYRNEGGLTFSDVSRPSGIARTFGHGLGVACADFDQDGRLDIYVANDLMRNQLWIGRPDGTFQDEALYLGCAVDADGKAEAGMGCLAFDHGDDGDLDLFMTHLDGETNTLYENVAGEFTDRTNAVGLGLASLASTGFGVGAHDFDHDGRRDFFVANGRVTRASTSDGQDAFVQANQLFRGIADGRFEELPALMGVSSTPIGVSRGAAFGDWDGDGDVDVAYLDNGGPLRLLENRAGGRGHWIALRVLERNELDALGASVRIEAGASSRWRQVQAAYSYCSSSDPRVHFGLAKHAGPVQATVRWIDGSEESYGDLSTDGEHVLRRGGGTPR